jgi:hypothetical protein
MKNFKARFELLWLEFTEGRPENLLVKLVDEEWITCVGG